MFPASLGLNAVSPPAPWPLCFVTPHGSFTSGNEVLFPSNFCSLYPSFCPNGMDKKSIKSSQVKKTNGSVHDGAGKNGNGPSHDTVLAPCPLRAMPVITVLSDNDEDLLLNDGLSTSDVKIEQPVPLGSCPVGVSVEAILMTFDALRRRLLQLEEVKDVNKRSVTKAGTIMMDHDLRANNVKRIGHVPGIEVGDLFYFRIEMCLVGLHAQSVSGIDYMTARFGDEDDPVAVAVVSAGGYENDDEDADVLIYTGQGGSGKNDKNKLMTRNLKGATLLLREVCIVAMRLGNPTAKDVSSPGSKIYIYDGLYKINKSWVEKAKSGFNVFKYKLVREPGQPDGIVTWKMIERWRKDPSLRGKVILPDMSSGDEKLPVCLVNDVDDEKGPSHFTYTTKLHVSSSISQNFAWLHVP
ncbi:hypothetical protein J5N97_014505 [Dioscorea zingiberensis]|uniref:YDG domain-containing protein n=1 Tax=Dioscorea zingiberensis TaxID=325984 RepID=A0A9D5CSN0_9LILI|nr:hypothetical protein J5N97_014505 [Dioscorea zingiberensis]